MSRAERIAKIERDLAELKARILRIQGECFLGARNCDELQAEVRALATKRDDG